jgi:Chromo (CHRromatin Organisation MOdifier) domain
VKKYQVERLLDVKRSGYHQEFLVKWLGYGHAHNSWEPLAHLNENCQEDVDLLLAERQVVSSGKRVRPVGRQQRSAPETLSMIQLQRALDQVQLESCPVELLQLDEIAQLDVSWKNAAVSPERWSCYSIQAR